MPMGILEITTRALRTLTSGSMKWGPADLVHEKVGHLLKVFPAEGDLLCMCSGAW